MLWLPIYQQFAFQVHELHEVVLIFFPFLHVSSFLVPLDVVVQQLLQLVVLQIVFAVYEEQLALLLRQLQVKIALKFFQ